MGIKCPKRHVENSDDNLNCSKFATPFASSKKTSVTKTLETPAEELTKGTTLNVISSIGKKTKGGKENVNSTN